MLASSVSAVLSTATLTCRYGSVMGPESVRGSVDSMVSAGASSMAPSVMSGLPSVLQGKHHAST